LGVAVGTGFVAARLLGCGGKAAWAEEQVPGADGAWAEEALAEGGLRPDGGRHGLLGRVCGAA
jgi:hypothetical protein